MNTNSSFQSVGTWKRYKLGQARFTDWLKQTASKFTPTPAPPPPTSHASSGSKSRKAPAPDSASDKVHWAELEYMAQTVVSNSKPEDIPWDPILVLRDVVALRKKSARFYSQSAEKDKTGKLKLSNQKHEHIIRVLEKVLGLLESAVSPLRSSRKEAEPRRERLDTHLLDNMFNLLQIEKKANGETIAKEATDDSKEIESDSESEAEAEPEAKTAGRKKAKQVSKKKGKGGKKGKKTPKSRAVVKNSKGGAGSEWVDTFMQDELGDDDEELDYYMLIYCFFEDFNAIRNHVCERWCDYFFDQSVSLKTLGVITNAAYELFHSIEAELLRILRKNRMSDLGSYEAMMEMLFFEFGMEHVDYDFEPATKEEQHEKIWREEADWLGWSTYVGIEDILDNMPPGKVPMIPPSSRKHPKYGPITSDDFATFNRACLFELFPEIAEVKALKKNMQEPPVLPGQPLMEFEFEQVLNARGYPSSFIFSVQLYLDIRNIMENKVTDAFDQLKIDAKSVARRMKHYTTTSKGLFGSDWYQLVKRELIILDHYVFDDFTYDDKKARAKGMRMTQKLPKFELFTVDPVWPALLDFRTVVESTMLGIRLITRTSAPLWSGVLYTVFKRDHPELGLSWPEFDKFLAYFGTDLLGFPITEDLKAANVLTKYANTMSDGRRIHAWTNVVEKAFQVANFQSRFADGTLHGTTNYISDVVRRHYGLPPDPSARPFGLPLRAPSLEETASQDKTQETLQRMRRFGNVPHVEILEILDQTVESMIHNEFAINYFKLDWEVAKFAEVLQDALVADGLLKDEQHLQTYMPKSEGDDALLTAAIKRAFASSIGQCPFEGDGDDESDQAIVKRGESGEDNDEWESDDEDDFDEDAYDDPDYAYRFERFMEGGAQGDLEIGIDDMPSWY